MRRASAAELLSIRERAAALALQRVMADRYRHS